MNLHRFYCEQINQPVAELDGCGGASFGAGSAIKGRRQGGIVRWQGDSGRGHNKNGKRKESDTASRGFEGF